MKKEIKEGWHESDFNNLQLVKSIKKEVYNKLIGVWMELNKKYRDGNKAYAELGKYIRSRC